MYSIKPSELTITEIKAKSIRVKKRKKNIYVYLDYSLSLQYSARCVRRAWYIWKLDKPITRHFSVTQSFTLSCLIDLSKFQIYIYISVFKNVANLKTCIKYKSLLFSHKERHYWIVCVFFCLLVRFFPEIVLVMINWSQDFESSNFVCNNIRDWQIGLLLCGSHL